MKTVKYCIVFCIAIVLAASNGWAWWSVPNELSTHDYLSDNALGQVPADYPDIARFGGDISDWTSGMLDDIASHNGVALLNGGPIEEWWDYALDNYKSGNFNAGDYSAFYYIGLMAHLTEDQAVPAHAFNIPHGSEGYEKDNVEELVYTNYNPTIWGFQTASYPTDNYYALRNLTLSDTSDSYWSQYWLSVSPYTVTTSDGNVLTFDGVYNGSGGPLDDDFPTWWIAAGQREQDLTRVVLGNAVAYTAGALMSISESLPPLARNLQVADTADGKTINFEVQENRTQGVAISLKVQETGQILKTTDGKVWDAGAENLDTNSNTSQLPWAKNFSLTWKGELSDGECLNGTYTLELTAEDTEAVPNAADPVTASVSVTAPVDITRDLVNDQISVAYPGGSIGPFTVTEKNNTGCKTTYTVTPYVISPSGATLTMPAIQTSLAANETRTQQHSLAVPDTAEAGYTIFGVIVTDANGNQIDSDTSGFTILAAPEAAPQKVSLAAKNIAVKKGLKRKPLRAPKTKTQTQTWRYIVLNK